MPTPRIQITINEPRLELRKEGWSKSRVASSIRAARLTKVPGPNSSCLDRFLPADMPNGVWQDPDTGYILMRPSALRADFTESPDFYSARIPLASLTVPSPVNGVPVFDEPADPTTGKPKLIALQRDDPEIDLPAITGVPAWANAVHAASNESSMVFVAATSTFALNEGVTITVQPSGLAIDRAAAWFGIMIGDRYYIQLGMNGSAALWEYRYSTCATGSSDDWVRRERFEYSQGGVDHTKPFQITILPWGMEFISILFSQATQTNQKARATDRRVSSNTFTFKITLGVDDLPRYDQTHGHYVKVEPAPVRIAMRKKGYQYAFAIARLRFAASTSFYGVPEQLTEPKGPNDVSVTPIGFYPGGSNIDGGKVNEDGAAWNVNSNVRFSPWLTLTSGGGGMYTPELWGVEYDVPASAHVPTTTPYDVSDAWTSLHWRETNHHDSSELSMVLRRDADWQNLLKLDGVVTVRVDNVERFQGYIEQYRPHFDGLPVTPMFDRRIAAGLPPSENAGIPLRDNPVADDHWQRLADTDAANFRSLTRKLIGDIFYEGFKRAGYDDAEIVIDAEVFDLQIGGFERASDWKQPQEDANVADLFRRIITTYGTQNAGNLRCVRRRGAWRVYIARAFNRAQDAPDVVFMLDDRVFFPNGATDAVRWSAQGGPYLRVLTQPEIYVRRPSFNELRCFTTDEPGENAIALAAFIAAHPKTITDPTFVRYEGRARPKTMGPSECGHLSTQNEIERFARRVYDEEYRTVIQWTHAAEWHPSVEPDMFAWIVGIGPDGYPVSYGVYRIEEVEITIDLDNVPDVADVGPWVARKIGDRSFTWQADYTFAWESFYESGQIPMFSEVHP